MKIKNQLPTALMSVSLSVILSACGQIAPTQVETQTSTQNPGSGPQLGNPDTGAPDEPPFDDVHELDKANQVCFPGNGAAPVCLSLMEPNDSEFRTNYRYGDPRTASDFPAGFDAAQYMPPKKFFRLANYAVNLPLTKNFGLNEFMSGVKGSYGIFSPYVVAALQKLRDMTGKSVRVNSAYRSPAYNQAVGGARWSRHAYGDGVDIAVDPNSKAQLSAACRKLGAGFTLIYATHVHCDWRTSPRISTASVDASGGEIEVMEVSHAEQQHRGKSADQLTQKNLGFQVHFSQANDESKNEMVPTAVARRSQVALAAEYIDLEGEGVPELEWQITAANGKSLKLLGQNVVFEGKRGAAYHVELLMGGHYKTIQTIHVPQK